MFSAQFGQGAVRDSTDSIDELVQRNIQEVLAAVQQQEVEIGSEPQVVSSTASAAARPTSGRPAAVARQTSTGPHHATSTSGRDGSAVAQPSTSAAPTPAGNSASTSMLDVPGHAEATIRLHKARIKSLEDDLSKLNKALADRDKQLADALRELKNLKAEQTAWSKDKKALEVQVDRLQKRAAEAEAALNSRELAAKEANKESSRVEREKRAAEQEARARDVRLQRALDEVEKYKAMLSELRTQEREGRDIVRADVNKLTTENKKLERQRAELLVAFKKQLKLIDVLKRQKVHLEAARALQFSESEFLQTLELGSA